MTTRAEAALLKVEGLTKRFPGVLALEDVALSVREGEVLAVIGENGAGKSTLMKILAGVQTADAGSIELQGQPVRIESVQDALHLGIALIHQELNLSDNLDVGANIFLGREPLRWGLIDKARIRRESRRVLDSVGLDISPDTIARQLSIGHQQLVEIAKALSVNARILIMDEPTSSLTQREADRLFEVVNDLRKRGVSIIYISHRLGEVKQLADRVTVMRDGKNAGDLSQSEISHDKMVGLMVGRDVSQFYARRDHKIGSPTLEVQNLRTAAYPGQSLSLSVAAGEIVGVFGLMGAGRTELLRTLFGIDAPWAGTVRVAGNPISLRSCRDAITAGLALVPEDRKQAGLILGMSVRHNTSLASLRRDRRAGVFLNQPAEQRLTQEMIRKLRIKTPSPDQFSRFLSGGNQQKVVLGKWLAMSPRVLLLDEPTRGIDVGAKQEIYKLMEELAESGVAVLFVSSEMEEVLGMSDRALVMHEGRITGELPRDQLSEETIMMLATGMTLATGSRLEKHSSEAMR